MKSIFLVWLAPWWRGLGREIESRLGICRVLAFIQKINSFVLYVGLPM
jgi:hypothetical protein